MNSLQELDKRGQSVWLDYIRRSLITSGELERLVKEDGLRGLTSNPAIFQKAISGSKDYDEALRTLALDMSLDPKAIYERLAIEDIQMAADILRPVYDQTTRRDGYVSLEVSPHLAHDTQGTVAEARRLWKAVARPNVMIKIPATPEGLPAITTLIGEGLNINVTLIFAQEVYAEVAEAFIAGVEQLATRDRDLGKVASVASFFVSRIDTLVDERLDEKIGQAKHDAERKALRNLQGQAAIANAKLAYQRYQQMFSSTRWKALAKRGAQTQRVLWASTSTKDPRYRDVLYVEELIGRETVNTMPTATLEAFRDHGKVRDTLTKGLDDARQVMQHLEEAGISFKDVTAQLLTEALRKFSEPFDQLLCTIEGARGEAAGALVGRQTFHLPDELLQMVDATLKDWQEHGKAHRLWAHDASLWTGTDEGKWLGWLGIVQEQLEHLAHLQSVIETAKSGEFSHILLLGMGGSSLAPDVLKTTFGTIKNFPELHVLDSTDPAQIKTVEEQIDLRRTLFIVSSKSGTTLEPNIFARYFFDRVTSALGTAEARRRFLAITDPGSKLQAVAERDGFRRIFFGVPTIGGRYSALSDFGMVPAAAMGLDVAKFLDRTEEMVQACSGCVPAAENPGVVLGAVLGVLGSRGRDKATLIASPTLKALGAWLEQLLAESTGKQGRGLIPIDGEEAGPPEVYGSDRLFVYLRFKPEADAAQDTTVARLEQAGHPVVRISVKDRYDLGQEFFRWEFATAVAGSILGINPFNQPDVEASKVATRALTADVEKNGSLPSETPLLEAEGLKLFADERNARELTKAIEGTPALTTYIEAHLGRIQPGDYVALLAYLEMNDAHRQTLQAVRHAIRDAKRVATCLGFGPRFLHSTGQAYKGGPNTGVVLQITCDDAADLRIPGQRYTFGVVKAAQARGDLQVLAARGRRVLRVHVGPDVTGGLRTLAAAVKRALSSKIPASIS
ncbi:MAG: transaldolase [Candidatus Omnitrophica bacterium CG11_big_fil_rev_8_21_14_0_20_63_9]|nr:MAG: transaldolase [Candidatus Omnitrophica bacterium CG11_big_fil_rev_8_21_14_0_20_63_9]